MTQSLQTEFFQFIQSADFPCIGAKAAAKKELIDILIAPDLRLGDFDSVILQHVYQFIKKWQLHKESLQTLAVIFQQPRELSEVEFEQFLWERLQKLHDIDSQNYPWDPRVKQDVTQPNFSFSLGGHGFFIVGLHANSSRKARRFSHPVLVFNLHEQFEMLREDDVFERMRNKIREKEIQLCGTVNPMVGDFGMVSEAIQYSGRKVPTDFHCPFLSHKNSTVWQTIAPKSAVAFKLPKGAILTVQDPNGEQVADLFCFSSSNYQEFLSSGRSIDYANKIYLTTGDSLYSNLSNKMLTITEDDVGIHDFLYTPCNKDTFRIIYDDKNPKAGCYENLANAFRPYNFPPIHIGTTFNIFMHVALELPGGELTVLPPKSKKGDLISFQSHMDLIIGLTACSAKQSNNNAFKPINFRLTHVEKNNGLIKRL